MYKNIVIWDLDGTLACGKHRLHKLPTKDLHLTESWVEFNLMCWNDAPIWDNIQLMHAMRKAGYVNVIVTGRSDIAQTMTETWLREHEVPYDGLIMRGSTDNRKDTVIKEEYLRQIGLDKILCCFDDLPQVASHLRSLGLTCHLVTEYNNTRTDLQSHGVEK